MGCQAGSQVPEYPWLSPPFSPQSLCAFSEALSDSSGHRQGCLAALLSCCIPEAPELCGEMGQIGLGGTQTSGSLEEGEPLDGFIGLGWVHERRVLLRSLVLIQGQKEKF